MDNKEEQEYCCLSSSGSGDESVSSAILLMHHWRPCLKLRSAILIVLSTVVAKDANHRFQA